MELSKPTMDCRYDDVKMACIPLLVSALRNDTAERETWTRLCEIIENHFKGELQHVTDTLSSLWETANRDDDGTVATTSNGTPSVRLFPPARRC